MKNKYRLVIDDDDGILVMAFTTLAIILTILYEVGYSILNGVAISLKPYLLLLVGFDILVLVSSLGVEQYEWKGYYHYKESVDKFIPEDTVRRDNNCSCARRFNYVTEFRDTPIVKNGYKGDLF